MGGSHNQSIETTPPTELQGLFRALWDELRHTLGSAPTAALLRRAIAMSRESCPIFGRITIDKGGRDYVYHLPQDIQDDGDLRNELSGFVDTVLSLLSELMGNVMVRHLLENPTIRKFKEKR